MFCNASATSDIIPPMIFAGAESNNVHQCELGTTACPALANGNQCSRNGSNYYCACGYVGPLCSECDISYFLTWHGTESKCSPCDESEGWLPTILAVVVFVNCITLATFVIIKDGRRKKLLQYYKIGKMKGVTLVQICQVEQQRQ